MFTARYALSPYITQINLVLKGLIGGRERTVRYERVYMQPSRASLGVDMVLRITAVLVMMRQGVVKLIKTEEAGTIVMVMEPDPNKYKVCVQCKKTNW